MLDFAVALREESDSKVLDVIANQSIFCMSLSVRRATVKSVIMSHHGLFDFVALREESDSKVCNI